MHKKPEVQAESANAVAETFPEICRGKELLYLSQADVLSCGIQQHELIEYVREALIAHGTELCEMPAKIGLHPLRNTLMHAMPAYVTRAQACGIKWATCFPENRRFALPQTAGVLILNDVQTGFPIAVMDAAWITAKRTPVVSALAVERLARPDSRVIGILGCGVQGFGHMEILPSFVPQLEEVRVYDVQQAAAEKLADKFDRTSSWKVKVAETIRDLCVDADIIVTATAILTAPNPQIRRVWIKPGALLLPVDFDSVFEWDAISSNNKFVVDSLDEMHYFMSVGYLAHGLPPVHAELGQIVAGLKPGRESATETIMDMNIGMGVEDVVVGKAVVERAIANGIGTRLEL